MGTLWARGLTSVLWFPLLCFMQYRVILGCVITETDCTMAFLYFTGIFEWWAVSCWICKWYVQVIHEWWLEIKKVAWTPTTMRQYIHEGDMNMNWVVYASTYMITNFSKRKYQHLYHHLFSILWHHLTILALKPVASGQIWLISWLFIPWLISNHSVWLCFRGKENLLNMMTSSNGNIFRVTDPLLVESTDHRWFLFTKANDAELWSFLLSAPQQTVEQTSKTPVIWKRHL